jgi:hypothetical protein
LNARDTRLNAQIAKIARIPYYSAEVNDNGNRRAQKFVFRGCRRRRRNEDVVDAGDMTRRIRIR